MATKKNKWAKWKIGSASVAAIFLMFNYTKSSDAFQKAHQTAIAAKNNTQSNQSLIQHNDRNDGEQRFRTRENNDFNNNSNFNNNNDFTNNNNRTFSTQQRQSHTRTGRS